jgi:lysophospholipase L1-like esterase
MRFFRPLLSLIASFVFAIAIAFPVAADARTAVIIGDSQAQGLHRPLTTALAGYDVEVTGQSSHAGKGLRWFLDNNTISSMVNSRNPQLVILIIGGNDDVQTSGASRTAYETKLRQAYNDAHARGADVVWIGPATSRDEGVQERHDRTATVQSSYVPSLGARWIDGRPGSAAGPFQQETNPGNGESQIRSRNSHLTGEGYRAWACALAPGIAGGGTPSSCPTGSEADQVFPDAVADVDSPSAAVADSSAGYSAACDPSDDAPVPITLGVNIGGIQQVTGLPEYINTVYRYLVSIILVVAIVMVVYGGFLYLTGAAGIGSIQRGKQIIRDALIGMVVVLAAYSILQTINPSTTQFRLNPESIECVGISASSTARDPNADEGGAIPACVRDSQCREGRVCLRTSNTEGLSSGQCTQGRANELCRCSGGCDVRTSEDGSPTNNNGTMQVACQEGTCQQIEGLWRCLTGETGSVCNMAADPQIPCAAGFTCQQGNEEQVGRCVTGDYRDYELDPRPVCSSLFYGPGGGERYYQETNIISNWEGGCNRVSGSGVDSFCMSHRYRCSTSAANPNRCSEEEYATLFGNTGVAYSWNFENAPENLRPWSYARFGCRKPIGASCSSDSECSSMCVGGVCTGFCAIRAESGIPRPPTGASPPRDQLEGACTTGCSASTWSATEFAINFTGSYLGTPIDGLDAVNPVRVEKAACYPVRVNGSKCDFNGQCQSGTCRFEPGASGGVFASFDRPMDMTAGIGTCSP